MTVSVAYLNTRYPSLSHTFIEREVRAVRDCGVAVHTFSIRRPSAHDILSDDHRAAAATTFYLVDGVGSLVLALLAAIFTHPFTLLKTLIRAQQLAQPGLRQRGLYVAYSVEAIRLARELRRRALTHIHVHMANNGAAVAMLACVFNASLSYSLSIHGSAEFFRVDSWGLRAKAEGARFVRCISTFCRAQVMAWTHPNHWDRFHIVHCGIDTNAFSPRRPNSGDALRMLSVGRLDPIKGYPLLLKACRQLSDEAIEWQLDMVGDGPMRELLAAQAEQLQISDRVTFSGAVGQDRIQSHFTAADVLVVSSFMEGIPVVLMEAMAMGLAVVSTRVGGVSELVEDGISGMLVPPGSEACLADALRRIADDRAQLETLGIAGRSRVAHEFSLTGTGRGMAELFEHYLAATPKLRVPGESEHVLAGQNIERSENLVR